MKFLETVRAILSSVVSLAILALLGGAAYLGYTVYQSSVLAKSEMERRLAEERSRVEKLTSEVNQKNAQIKQLTGDLQAAREELEKKEREIQRLTLALQLLKVDRRVAFLDVLSQEKNENGETVRTTVRFVEIDEAGRPIDGPRTFTVLGDKVYVDALVVKFADHYIEQGDPLRAASLCLFQRVFGNAQPPDAGVRIDQEDSQPAVYRTGHLKSDFEREIWAQFWEFARSEEKARKAGIRAAHGEAVYVQAVPGVRYRLSLRASDGLSIVPDGPVPDISDKAL